MVILEAKDIYKTYKGNIQALSSFEISIENGKIIGFAGPNGAGKSTLINILAGLIKKDKGIIRFKNITISEYDFEYKKFIGWMFENPLYFEKLSVKEYLEFVATMYNLSTKEINDRINELLDFFNLTNERNNWIETYSAGMKKKVSLAAAIIHKPELLILDEPLEGIDPMSAKHIKDLLKRMKKKGLTIFLSSHNLYMIEDLCDEVAIINKGKLVYQSKTSDIRKKIKNDVSKETYSSLEEIFLDIVGASNDKEEEKKLSWL